MPRPPMSRLPTALTSSMLPGFTLLLSLPTSTTLSGFTAAAATSPFTGSVPGAGFEGALSPSTGVVPGAGFEAWVSPATGAVPGAGCDCVEGVLGVGWLASGCCCAVGAADGVDGGVDCWGVDCAQAAVAIASPRPAAIPASFAAFESLQNLLITSPPGPTRGRCRFARLVRR